MKLQATKRVIRRVEAYAAVIGLVAPFVMAGDQPPPQSILNAYEQRLVTIRAQIPAMVASANAAADCMVGTPQASLVCLSFKGSTEFSNEMMSRAGGIAKVSSKVGKGAEAAIVLVPVRSWEQEAATVLPLLAERHGKAGLVVVIGSKAGMPTNAVCDVVLDNGAATGSASEGPLNIIANVTLGWMWHCEYAAALSRKGKYPGVLRTKVLTDSQTNNPPLRPPAGQAWLGDTDKPVDAGRLAGAYLERAEQLVRDLHSVRTQAAVSNAADIVADRLRRGRTVQLSGSGHIANYEILRDDFKERYKAIHSTKVGSGLTNGDLLVWFGYMGYVGLMKTGGVDRLTELKQAGVDVVLCEPPLPSASNTAPEILALVDDTVLFKAPTPSPIIATIDQAWGMPDAEVSIPWPPGRMAPISGVNALLLLRMLDEQVVFRSVAETR